MKKRDFIKTGIIGLVGLSSTPSFSKTNIFHTKKFRIPGLPYAYGALRPFLSQRSLEKLYLKEYTGYLNNFNNAVSRHSVQAQSTKEILYQASAYRKEVVENGAGYFNYKLFWKILTPDFKKPVGSINQAIIDQFGSFQDFQDKFSSFAVTEENTRWIWLTSRNNSLHITITSIQECPFMNTLTEGQQGFPLMNLFIRNDISGPKNSTERHNYVNTYWKFINWEKVDQRFEKWG